MFPRLALLSARLQSLDAEVRYRVVSTIERIFAVVELFVMLGKMQVYY